MALPTRLRSTWVRRCSSPIPIGRDLATSVLSASFLLCARDSVAERTVSTTLAMAYSTMFSVNWPDSILATSSTVLMSPKRCLPLERMRVSASHDVPVLAPLRLHDPDDHLCAVDVAGSEPDDLAGTKPTAIAEREHHLIQIGRASCRGSV